MQIENFKVSQKVQIQEEAQKPHLLPENFIVYTDDEIVAAWPFPGGEARILPTYNHYKGMDGGYVAIYTHDETQGVYSVGEGIYVVGQLRVPGEYVGRIFVPTGYAYGDDITQDANILSICHSYFPELEGRVWIGGDTGGWALRSEVEDTFI